MSFSERKREINRRRHRRKKIDMYKQRLEKATVSEKQQIASKLRELTPGAETIITNLSVEER